MSEGESHAYWYEIVPVSPAYKGEGPLTYQANEQLSAGQIVRTPLRKQHVYGVVTRAVPKPKFATKPITATTSYHLPVPLLTTTSWIADYYAAPLAGVLGLAVPSNLDTVSRLKAPIVTHGKQVKLPAITATQARVLKQIDTTGTYLLHGDTGTGKTRVYIELAKRSLDAGRSVILLTPEIALTPQLVQDVSAALGSSVIVTHSELTIAERRDIWKRIHDTTKPLVVIGPRSALFMPLKNVGLVVVDECHEPAYKQEQTPRYHAIRVASKLAAEHHAALILGSATPSVHDYYYAEQKKLPIIRMTEQATTTVVADKKIDVVDQRDATNRSQYPGITTQLLQGLQAALERNEQALIFLNRRGSARLITCVTCGWHALCPHCDIPLTYHDDSHSVRCHTCGFQTSAPTSCPECKGTELLYSSIGTKSIVSSLQHAFPDARILRFDSDNTKEEHLTRHYDDVRAGKVQILIGTQMLAKGLDLPKLGYLGILHADASLLFPDFTAEERTYQLILQLLGRVGRGHRSGHVVLQTYNPDSPVLGAALSNNWASFYKNQLSERQTYHFPPFVFMLKLTATRARQSSAEQVLGKLNTKIIQSYRGVQVSGPAPAFKEKQRGSFTWQLVVRSSQRNTLVAIARNLPTQVHFDLDPINLL